MDSAKDAEDRRVPDTSRKQVHAQYGVKTPASLFLTVSFGFIFIFPFNFKLRFHLGMHTCS